jgi:hypothetical protein
MEQIIEVTLDESGGILIPPAASASLGLSPGMTLIVEEADEGGVRLHAQPETPLLVDKGGVLVVRAEPVGDLANIVEQERNRRALDLMERPDR